MMQITDVQKDIVIQKSMTDMLPGEMCRMVSTVNSDEWDYVYRLAKDSDFIVINLSKEYHYSYAEADYEKVIPCNEHETVIVEYRTD